MTLSFAYRILQGLFYCFCINAIAVFWIRSIDLIPLKYLAVLTCTYLIYKVDSFWDKTNITYLSYIYYSLAFAYIWYKSFID
jgi:hypothetical protein